MSCMESWEKLNPNHTTQGDPGCVFFQVFLGTFADERASTKRKALCGFHAQPMYLSQQEGASALPPVSQELASKMTDS